MKKLLTVCITAVMLLMCCCEAAFAAVTIELDGHSIPSDVVPIVQNGRTLVPLRTVSEALGATVMWKDNEASIKTYEGEKMRFTPGSKTAVYEKADGTKTSVKLDVPAVMRDNRVMVPLRVIAETFNVKTDYQNGKVSLSSTPVYVDGKPLTAFVNYIKMTMGGYSTAYWGNAQVARMYDYFSDLTETAKPERFGTIRSLDFGEDYYCYAGTYSFFSEAPQGKETGLVNYDVYYRMSDAPVPEGKYPDTLLQNLATDKWYLPATSQPFYEVIDGIWPNGLSEQIFNDVV